MRKAKKVGTGPSLSYWSIGVFYGRWPCRTIRFPLCFSMLLSSCLRFALQLAVQLKDSVIGLRPASRPPLTEGCGRGERPAELLESIPSSPRDPSTFLEHASRWHQVHWTGLAGASTSLPSWTAHEACDRHAFGTPGRRMCNFLGFGRTTSWIWSERKLQVEFFEKSFGI